MSSDCPGSLQTASAIDTGAPGRRQRKFPVMSIGHLASGVICIGVFEARDGGSPATQGTISASDWLAKWMEKSERILGQKRLHECVRGGVTHARSFNLQNSDPSVEYFFSSQVLVSSTSATITGYLNAGFRYFEVEFYQASASTFQISVGSFTAGNTFQLSDLTGSLDNFRLLNLHEMFVELKMLLAESLTLRKNRRTL